jgi:hypothetical protein
MKNTTIYGLAAVILAVLAIYAIRRRRNPGSDSDRFVNKLLSLSARHIAESLALNNTEVEAALLQCRSGASSDLAQKLNVRIDCSLKKVSASRLAVTLSVAYLKEGKVNLTRISQEVSWDDLPREIRSRFIKENPDELCYVIVEKPGSVGLEQATAKET